MKKGICVILVCMVFVLSVGVQAMAMPRQVPKIGSVVGEVLKTDIVARINDYEIASYNVEGYTYIVAENLRYYGFDVRYTDETRQLFVDRNELKTSVTNDYTKPYVSPFEIGKKDADILYTDIICIVEGEEVESYNIGGLTLIKFDCLEKYGAVSYDNLLREISVELSWVENNPNGFNGRLQSFYGELSEEEKTSAMTFFNDMYIPYYRCMKECHDRRYDMGDLEFDEFGKGILAIDMNDDRIPEIFSLDWSGNAIGYEITASGVVRANDDCSFGYIEERLPKVTSRYMNTESFCGVYRNNTTGEKAIIAYTSGSDEERARAIKIITFDGEKFHSQDRKDEDIDSVMAEYTEIEDEIAYDMAIRGLFIPHYSLEECVMDFYSMEKETYENAPEGEGYYYIKNYAPEKNEITLIPVREVSYEEHLKAQEIDASGEDVFITDDGYAMRSRAEIDGVFGSFYNTVVDYLYTVPSEDQTGIVIGFMDKTPVKAQLAENLNVEYPYGDGINMEYIPTKDYFANFAMYDQLNYYRAVVTDGIITALECVFHP